MKTQFTDNRPKVQPLLNSHDLRTGNTYEEQHTGIIGIFTSGGYFVNLETGEQYTRTELINGPSYFKQVTLKVEIN